MRKKLRKQILILYTTGAMAMAFAIVLMEIIAMIMSFNDPAGAVTHIYNDYGERNLELILAIIALPRIIYLFFNTLNDLEETEN